MLFKNGLLFINADLMLGSLQNLGQPEPLMPSILI